MSPTTLNPKPLDQPGDQPSESRQAGLLSGLGRRRGEFRVFGDLGFRTWDLGLGLQGV